MQLSRRSFLGSAAMSAGALASGRCNAIAAASAMPRALPPVKFAIATYSYWHFKPTKVSVETVIEKAAALGVEGVDLLHRQMELPEKEALTSDHRRYLQRLKRHAFRNGIDLACLSIHQDFVDPDPEVLRVQVEHTHKCIEI